MNQRLSAFSKIIGPRILFASTITDISHFVQQVVL